MVRILILFCGLSTFLDSTNYEDDPTQWQNKNLSYNIPQFDVSETIAKPRNLDGGVPFPRGQGRRTAEY